MSPEEITIRDLLAERDRATAAKLDAIAQRVDETRADVRRLGDQLVGVATAREIASFKREMRGQVGALDARLDAVEQRLDTRDALDADAERRRKRRAWILPTLLASTTSLLGVVLGLVGERMLAG